MANLEIRTDFPRKVREIENTWIPMPDGTQLAARIWLPEDAEEDPVPAILEYLPYRKRDGTVERDHLTHPYFAGHGYASVRVDLRGTGDSEGLCHGEYLKEEQDDALAVIDWLAAQPWCSGAVGMIGISWGGFNGLQVAARQPAALKAVITLCSTDDRYADDIHFMGGALLTDKLAWGATAFSIAMTPPDPAIVGYRWREMWLERLAGNGHWMFDWFRHQRRDAFYKHGSICEDYAQVQVPVYAVGGWADGYTNPIFRMMEHLPGPRKALIGPWAHKYPHFATPGPRIGFLQECLRWWDQHLKGLDTGIMAEPMIRAWVQDPARPTPLHTERAGRWVAEPGWSSDRPAKVWRLGPAGLTTEPQAGADIVVSSPQTAGRTAPDWCCYGLEADGPRDQRGEAGLVTIFETAPLAADIDLLGFPILEAKVASDRPVAQIAAVLSAVDTDGAATMLTYGVLNLTHRRSHEAPEPMPEGKAEPIRVQLNVCGQRIAAGQRIRLALSSAYWPILWPAPERATLTLVAGTARLALPVRTARPEDAALPEFGPPEGAQPLEAEQLSAGTSCRRIVSDLTTGTETFERFADTGQERHAHTGLTLHYRTEERFSIHPEDATSATGRCRWRKSYGRDDWQVEVETETQVEALREVWRLSAHVVARENGKEIFRKAYAEDIKRDLT
jgi:putative CocE/NonD family hydrolase